MTAIKPELVAKTIHNLRETAKMTQAAGVTAEVEPADLLILCDAANAATASTPHDDPELPRTPVEALRWAAWRLYREAAALVSSADVAYGRLSPEAFDHSMSVNKDRS